MPGGTVFQAQTAGKETVPSTLPDSWNWALTLLLRLLPLSPSQVPTQILTGFCLLADGVILQQVFWEIPNDSLKEDWPICSNPTKTFKNSKRGKQARVWTEYLNQSKRTKGVSCGRIFDHKIIFSSQWRVLEVGWGRTAPVGQLFYEVKYRVLVNSSKGTRCL